jgi:ABC-type transport system involved in cytochrome c biogenesis permease subunit
VIALRDCVIALRDCVIPLRDCVATCGASDLFNVWTSVFTGAAFSLFLAATLGGRAVDNATAMAAIAVSFVVNVFLAFSSNGLLPTAVTPALDSYWTNVLVNVAFIGTAAVVGLARRVCPCCRRRESRYGEFKLVGATGRDEGEESEDDITPGGRGQFRA